MAPIFHPFTNAFSRGTLYGAVMLLALTGYVVYAVATSDYVTQSHVVREQPVDFSHRHHVKGLGIDCRFCHSTVETSAFAGLPSTEVCMNCHSLVWSDSPKLEAVRESYRTGKPLAWTRVTDLPDFVHFNHSIHVGKGIACRECHGPVDDMPLTWRDQSMPMRWCLDCHRAPEEHVRPRSEVFAMNLPSPGADERRDLAAAYQLRRPTDCSSCHY